MNAPGFGKRSEPAYTNLLLPLLRPGLLKIKHAWTWWTCQEEKWLGSDKASTRQTKRGKLGLPPYHARCRTITVGAYGSQT